MFYMRVNQEQEKTFFKNRMLLQIIQQNFKNKNRFFFKNETIPSNTTKDRTFLQSNKKNQI